MLSVIICTHNPRHDHLARTIDALEAQDLPLALWEVIIIDNASQFPVADTVDLSWHPRGKVIVEKNLGLTNARLRGIAETDSELVLWVDDDNILTPEYLSTLLDLANTHPALAVFGAGRILPAYEEPPAPELNPYLEMLTLRDLPDPCWSNDPTDNTRPYGAGMAVRREILSTYAERTLNDQRLLTLGRKGEELSSAEDEEFNWIACELGFGKGIFPSLELVHLIDKKRLTKDYLINLCKGHLASQTVLLRTHGKPAPEHYVPSWSFLLSRVLSENVNIYNKFYNFNKDIMLRMDYHKATVTDRAFRLAKMHGVEEGRKILADLEQKSPDALQLNRDDSQRQHHSPLPREREISA